MSEWKVLEQRRNGGFWSHVRFEVYCDHVRMETIILVNLGFPRGVQAL